MLGLLGAKLYFSCLRVPGSIAYAVSHPTLFRLCIDCLQVPDICDSRNVSERNNFEKLAPFAISTLESLLPLLNFYEFDSDASTINLLTSKLCELAGTEFSNATVDFNQNFLNIPERERRRQRYSHSYVLTSLAYQGLSFLINSDEHDEKKCICRYILHFLSRHILCCKVKNVPIPAKFLNIKNKAVSFICYSLQNNKNLLSELTSTALKRLCLKVEDKSDFRVAASHAVFTIMFSLYANDLAEFINWLLQLIDSTETSSRIFALEVLGFYWVTTYHKLTKQDYEKTKLYIFLLYLLFLPF
ncbi:condensin-2 complex subunit D3 [Caerostris extrusa]|uniref:Condensin-2 complex subunit D3 n=1 Tax=Caerostris extrusa TaxID=172846 RepID=A0AAV4R7C3_CAEEX|nr:condensin-2 complex subunit D3 [Caerostris extrusa]